MELENLVVLQYSPNNCYVQVVDVKDVKEKNFSIDIPKETWSYDSWKDIEIGNSRSPFHPRNGLYEYGIIGVYNRLDTKHISNLASAAREFTFPKRGFSDED